MPSKSPQYIVQGRVMAPLATNVGKHRKPSPKCLRAHYKLTKKKAKQYSTANAVRARPGKPLAKGPLASYQRKDSEQIAEDRGSL